jgi:hypothetical protein
MRTRERAASLPSETARLLRDDTVKPQVRLPDVQPGHRAPGDHPLDLRCALEDREDRGLADSFRRSAACGGAVVSARIQHRIPEGGGGFGRPADDPSTMARGGPRRATDLATTPNFPLPARLRQVHPRYICSLTCLQVSGAGGEPYSEGAGSRRSSAKTRTKRAMSSGGSTRPCLSSRFAIPQMERPGRRAADRDVCAGRVLAGAKRRLLELEGDRVGAAVVEAEAELLAGARPGL